MGALVPVAAAQEVVQALPSEESLELKAALSRLGRNPRDVDALVEAGEAASAMGDVEAAVGFFTRAGQIKSGDPRVKAGLASAKVRSGDPYGAIPLFDEAARAGANPAKIAGDRGLAYDLVGDPASAQRYYRQALAAKPDDEVSRRLALSLAISGQEREVEATLLPLLRKQDKAAWRARAFSLAILGKTKDAIKITETLLPQQLSKSITPYLNYMPRLTAAQQAAAANLGKFPKASEIGQDDPRAAALARAKPTTQVAAVDRGLVPTGQPLGSVATPVKDASDGKTLARTERERSLAMRKARQVAERRAETAEQSRTARTKPPEPKPTRETEASPVRVAAATPVPTPGSAARSVPAPKTAPAPTPAPTSAPAPASAAMAAPVTATATARDPGPGFDLQSLPASQSTGVAAAIVEGKPAPRPAATAPAAPVPSPPASAAAVPTPQPGRMGSLADAFGDLGKPVLAPVPLDGAVDLRKIEPARPKAEVAEAKVEAPAVKPKEPAKPSHPSRIWVQIGIGQDKAALAFDWRRMAKKMPEVFKGREPFVSEMGRTNRMLAGPFESQKAASAFVADLEKAGMDGPYIWTSPAGQVVDSL